MYTVFSEKGKHTITEANVNFYANPFVHPKRKIKDHDFIYMIKGNWTFGQNDEMFELKEDHILILSANMEHRGLTPCDADTKTMYFHVTFSEDKYLNTSTDDAIPSLINTVSNPGIKKIFSKLVNAKLQNKQKKADLYFRLLLLELEELNDSDIQNDIAHSIKEMIHNNPEKFFSNKDFATKYNLSVKSCEMHFKKAFSTTIHKYMLSFKIEEAKSYFKNFPQMTVKEIAFNLGFYDEYHFSRQFKSVTGKSPAHYRDALKE